MKRKRGSHASSKKKHGHGHSHSKGGGAAVTLSTMEQDNYLCELLSEKREASHRWRRSSARPGVWQPQLERIAEEPSN
ncbi:hypothetical protein BAE44_0005781 [Dichanthelium oligosanthes]|uniref:Uncharacterized protein n=1 Tax=Dichanthelium oligosanthes TaxID=888268 RepID=A0A1E5W7I1_9POAL|nr:hypothetical protein BAE44_0005781 [Dichanthelium oligosanthes]